LQVGEAYVEISTKDNQLVKGLSDAQGKVEKSMNAIAAKMANVGKVMTVAGAAITTGFGLTVKAAIDFNKEVANIATLIPGATGRVDELKSAIRDMAVTVGKDTTDLAQGAYQVISAFGDTADTVGILGISAKAATAGVATTTDAIDLLSAVTKGYGDTSTEAVQKASDLAFQTVTLGQTTFPELAASIGRVIPLTSELGVSQEELFAVMATGTGVTGKAAEVSTQLRGIMQSLMSPTADMTKLLGEKGYASGKAMLADLGLAGALDTIKSAADATNTPLQKYISSIEGQTLALALTGTQADNYITKLAAMRDSTGLTDIAFREQTEGVNAAGFAFQQAKIQIGVFAQEIGDNLLPILVPLIQKFTEIVGKVRDWMKENPKLTETIVLITAGIGVLMLGLGPLLMMLPGLVTAFAAVKIAIISLGIVGSGPIGWLILAIGAVYLAFRNWDKIVEIVGTVKNVVIKKIEEWSVSLNKWWDNIVENTDNKWILVADKIIKGIGNAYKWLTANIPNKWIPQISGWWNSIKLDTDSIWNRIAKTIIDSAKAWFNFFADTLPSWILDIIRWWEKIRDNTESIWGAIYVAVVLVVDNLLQKIGLRWRDVHDDTKSTWENIKTAITNITKGIWDKVKSNLEPVVKLINNLWENIKTGTSTTWGTVGTAINYEIDKIISAMNKIKKAISTLWDGLISKTSSVWGDTKSAIESKVDSIKWIIDSIWSGFVNNTYSVWNSVKSVISSAVDRINSTIDGIKWAIDRIWDGLVYYTSYVWEGVKSTIKYAIDEIKWVIDGIKSIANNIWGYIISYTSDIWGSVKSTISYAVNEIKWAIDGIKTVTGRVWDNIISYTSDIWSFVKAQVSYWADIIISTIDKIRTAISWVWSGFISEASRVWNEVKDVVISAIRKIIEAINTMNSAISGAPTISLPSYQHGTPYVPETGLALLHKGEAVIPAGQNTYNQQKSYSSINMEAGSIQIITPKFGESDAQNIFQLIERQARMRGLKFAI